MAGELTSASLIGDLRYALRHLYISAELRKSPLHRLLGTDAQSGVPALRAMLLEAIEALKPPAKTPARARPWRAYNCLLYLYVQQFSQEEVAAALAIGVRQLRRQERQALELLADYLRARYGLQDLPAGDGTAPHVGADIEPLRAAVPGRDQELEWLERSLPVDVAGIDDLLKVALTTAAPLARQLEVRLEPRLPADALRVAVQQAPMQQALLMALTAAIRSVPGGRVEIEAAVQGGAVPVLFRPAGPGASLPALPDDSLESLELAGRLVALSGGSLQVALSGGEEQELTIRLTLARAEETAVLAIDDNADALQLFQRYLAGSHYPFIGARDPQQALTLAQELRPRIIVLDIMIPGVDGWQMLAYLREHPRTHDVPVIVCSILPEEQLAMTLGAAAFLRKPVSREAFLEAIDRLAGPSVRETGSPSRCNQEAEAPRDPQPG
jgi:CheY-like chemotaxis protein